jgi:hypothetical protein
MEAGLGSGRRGGLPHGCVLLRLILEQLGYQAYLSPGLRLEEDSDPIHSIAAKVCSRKLISKILYKTTIAPVLMA